MIQQRKKGKLYRRIKRKRMRKRMFLFGCGCLVVGLVLAGGFFLRKLFLHSDSSLTNIADIRTLEVNSKEEYPESLLELLERNPETEDFVLQYPKNKNQEFEIDLSGDVIKGQIPLFLQWDIRWGYEIYGSDFLGVTGCGPTCLSMVWCGLSGDTKWNPLEVAKMAEDQGFYVDGAGSSWELMSTGAEILGLEVHTVTYDKTHILEVLSSGDPIICIMGPGDFTASGHFIVLRGLDQQGKVLICDPNSRINSEKSWDIEGLLPQIKNLWSYTYSN